MKFLSHSRSKHLSRSILLEETGSPAIIRLIITFSSILVIAFVSWASWAKIDETAIAKGVIIPSGHVQKVQHLAGGVISSIYVREGQIVKPGERLLQFDTLIAESQRNQALVKQKALLGKKARLIAYIENKSNEYLAKNSTDQKFESDQQRILSHLSNTMITRRSIFRSQIRQLRSDIKEQKKRKEVLLRQQELLQQELKIKKELFDKRLIQLSELLSIQKQLNTVQGDIDLIPTERAKTLEKIRETRGRLKEIDLNIKEKYILDLASVNESLSQLEEVIKQHKKTVSQSIILAPTHGIIHSFKFKGTGGVVAPGNTILEIVPIEEKLIAEIEISTRDIGHIKTGQSVNLKFTTYDFARYGGIKGRLVEISPTTLLNTSGSPYYRGIVNFSSSHIGKKSGKNPILPGMTLQADIKTGSKTVMEYLLKPVFVSAKQALRER